MHFFYWFLQLKCQTQWILIQVYFFSFLNFSVPYATTKLLLLRDMEGKMNQQTTGTNIY